MTWYRSWLKRSAEQVEVPNGKQHVGRMTSETEIIRRRAPTLYAIIAIKLFKGLLFLSIALIAYTLSDNDLPADLKHWLQVLKFHPESKFWADIARRLGQVTEAGLLKAAAGIFIYSLFSLVEGVGLLFRVSWAGWMAIGESAFFIPIEVYELLHHVPGKGHPWLVFVILIINIVIVWYLLRNRHRLFKHHSH